MIDLPSLFELQLSSETYVRTYWYFIMASMIIIIIWQVNAYKTIIVLLTNKKQHFIIVKIVSRQLSDNLICDTVTNNVFNYFQ